MVRGRRRDGGDPRDRRARRADSSTRRGGDDRHRCPVHSGRSRQRQGAGRLRCVHRRQRGSAGGCAVTEPTRSPPGPGCRPAPLRAPPPPCRAGHGSTRSRTAAGWAAPRRRSAAPADRRGHGYDVCLVPPVGPAGQPSVHRHREKELQHLGGRQVSVRSVPAAGLRAAWFGDGGQLSGFIVEAAPCPLLLSLWRTSRSEGITPDHGSRHPDWTRWRRIRHIEARSGPCPSRPPLT